jgi:hypothetical protein
MNLAASHSSSPFSSNLLRACAFVFFVSALIVTFVAFINRPQDQAPEPISASKRLLSTLFVPEVGQMLSTNSSLAILSELLLRASFNRQRQSNCTHIPLYIRPGLIQYAKQTNDSGETRYMTEVTFEDDSVFAQFAVYPNISGSNPELKLLWSTPEPCDKAIKDQLATSSLGKHMTTNHIGIYLKVLLNSTPCPFAAVEKINKQNLTWKATLSPQFEGMRISAFGLGYIPLLKEERRSFLMQLGMPDSNLTSRRADQASIVEQGHHRAMRRAGTAGITSNMIR